MSLEGEFAVVEIIENSGAETLGVDALNLSIVKLELQLRRFFTHLVFQCEAFNAESVPELVKALEERSNVNVTGFITGTEALVRFSVADMVGARYAELRAGLGRIYKVRNKVFHGQLTGQSLDRCELLRMGATVKEWCELLSAGAQERVGYDGFGRDSFRKSGRIIAANYRVQLENVDAYRAFIAAHVVGRTSW